MLFLHKREEILLNREYNTDRKTNEIDQEESDRITLSQKSKTYTEKDMAEKNISFSQMCSMFSNLDSLSYGNILQVIKMKYKNKLHSTGIKLLEDSVFESIYTDILQNSNNDTDKLEKLKKLAYGITLFVKIIKKDPTILSFGSCFCAAKIYVVLDSIKEMWEDVDQFECDGSLVAALSWFFNVAGAKVTRETICNSRNEEEKNSKIRDISIVLEVINSNWENVHLMINNSKTMENVTTLTMIEDNAILDPEFITSDNQTPSLENCASDNTSNENCSTNLLHHPLQNDNTSRSVHLSGTVLTVSPEDSTGGVNPSKNVESNKNNSSEDDLKNIYPLVGSVNKSSLVGENNKDENVHDHDKNIQHNISRSEKLPNLQEYQNPNKHSKNRKTCCFYCKKIVLSIARHLQTIHKNEKEMIQLKKLKNSTERNGLLAEIRHKGNHIYTQQLLADTTSQGSVQPTSLMIRNCTNFKSGPKTLEEVVMCTFCKGVYVKKYFHRHIKTCYSKKKFDSSLVMRNKESKLDNQENTIQENLSKGYYCLYCKKTVPKFIRHVLVKHKDKKPVIQYRKLLKENSVDSKTKRQKIMRSLQLKSNNAYVKKLAENPSSMKILQECTSKRCYNLTKTPQKRINEVRQQVMDYESGRIVDNLEKTNCNVSTKSNGQEIRDYQRSARDSINNSAKVNKRSLTVRKYAFPLCPALSPLSQSSTKFTESRNFPQTVEKCPLLQSNEDGNEVILSETISKNQPEISKEGLRTLKDQESKGNNSAKIDLGEGVSSSHSLTINRKHENEEIVQEKNKCKKNSAPSGKKPNNLTSRNYCMFCKTIVNNFRKHILKTHRDNNTVVRYLALMKNQSNKKERLIIFNKLRLKSNNVYNKVMVKKSKSMNSKGKNMMMAKKYSKKDAHTICKSCKNVYIKSSLNRHECNKTDRDTHNGVYSSETISLDTGNCYKNKCFAVELVTNGGNSLIDHNITQYLQKNHVTQVALNDTLLMSVVCRCWEKVKEKNNKVLERYTFDKIKIGCSFLMKLREKDCSIHQLVDCLVPSKKEIVSEIIKGMCKFDETTGRVGKSSMPSRLLRFMRDATAQALKDVVLKQPSNGENKTALIQGTDEIFSVLQKMILLSKSQKERLEEPPSKDISNKKVNTDFVRVIDSLQPAFTKSTDYPIQYEVSSEYVNEEMCSTNVNSDSSVSINPDTKSESSKNNEIFLSGESTKKPLSNHVDSLKEKFNCALPLRTIEDFENSAPANEDNSPSIDKSSGISFERDTASEKKLDSSSADTVQISIGGKLSRIDGSNLMEHKPSSSEEYASTMHCNLQNYYHDNLITEPSTNSSPVNSAWQVGLFRKTKQYLPKAKECNGHTTERYNILRQSCKPSHITGKKLKRTKHYCMYCKRFVLKFIPHVLVRHKDKEPVIQYTSLLEENSNHSKTKRRKIMRLLLLKSNKAYISKRAHNLSLIEISQKCTTQRFSKSSKTTHRNEGVTEVGEDVRVYESERLIENGKTPNSNILTNSDSHDICLNIIKKENKRIWPVRKYASPLCPALSPIPEASTKLRELVFPRIFLDSVSKVAMKDALLMKTASSVLERKYNKVKDSGFSCTTNLIRDGGKLLKCVQSLDKTITGFRDLFKPSKVNSVFEAAKEICGLDEKTGSIKFTSTPFRITYVINQVAAQVVEEASTDISLNENDKKLILKDIDEFLEKKREKFRSIITRWPASKKQRKSWNSRESDEESNDDNFPDVSTSIEGSSSIKKKSNKCGSGRLATKRRNIYTSSESEDTSFDESDGDCNPTLKHKTGEKLSCRKTLTSEDCNTNSPPKEEFSFFPKKRWTEQQKRIVLLEFKEFIINGTNPGRKRCRELIASSEELAGRTADQVNLIIDNINKGKLKLPSEFEYLRSQRAC